MSKTPSSPQRAPGKGEPSRLARIGQAVIEAGPLILFLAVERFAGVRLAIAAAIFAVVLGFLYRRWMGIANTRLGLLAAGLTVVFGAIDLLSDTPFMLQYEGVISNFVVGIVFFWSTRGKTPLIEELAVRHGGISTEDRPDLHRFFDYLSLTWAVYFLVKAALYFWISLRMPLEDALQWRAIWGTLSLAAMALATGVLSRPAFRALRRRGLLEAPKRSAKSSDTDSGAPDRKEPRS
ncbi:septation protein IspZ [Poseidonocella sedimentorum]|uniref:Intracellular septation protein A n=1 Tax=Poseidonocella sedimentorum TaxID=871652 RepID=A0A1I6DL04_9RHOB|nr:septation protein IspZ [Poseidonocella sedimentorum]SFR06120.1 Intracellular septation protein A [Poseidonocella sedimentorum]